MTESERTILAAVLSLAGGSGLGFGSWLIARGELPGWMTGIWKWPAGDNLTPMVVRTMGWANVLAAAACPPAILILIIWNRGSGVWVAAMGAMFLAGAATFAVAWSVVISRDRGASEPALKESSESEPDSTRVGGA